MSQISPPMRIVLAVAVLFAAAWFTMLRPKPADEAAAPAAAAPAAPAAAAPQSAPGQAVDAARDAAAAAGDASAARAGEAPAAAAPSTSSSSATAPAPGTAPAPAAAKPKDDLAKSGLPADLVADMDEKVVVLFFGNDKAQDDRAVERSLGDVYEHQNQVAVHKASIEDVAKYAAITRGANVQQSPTTLVIDRHRTVNPLVGFVDVASINQAVIDALLVDGAPVADDKYLQKLEGTCSGVNRKIRNLETPRNFKEFKAYLAKLSKISKRLNSRIRGLKAPRKHRSLHRELVALSNADDRLVSQVERAVRTGRAPAAAIGDSVRALNKRAKVLDLRLAGLGMDDCR